MLDNLTHVQVTAGSQSRNQDYCYDGANRLTNLKTGGCGGTSVIGLGYDVQGNLANKNGVLYGFDYGNRLRSGGPETYRYDAYGRRVRSINATGGILYSLYGQAGQLLWQRDQRTSQRRNYVYLQGSLLAEHRRPIGSTTETIVYQHTDALGSPVATTDSSKTVLQRSEYEPYGALLNRAMEDGPGYTGHATDAATGLVYMQQRYYDPLISRFLSVDPVASDTKTAWNFNRYNYAANNPYRFTDPDGRCIWDGCIAEIVVGGMLIGAGIDIVSQKLSNPNQPISKTSVAISAVAGGLTTVMPGVAALRVASIPAKVAVSSGTAGVIGGAASAAKQEITTGKVSAGQVAVDAIASAGGQAVGGTVGASLGRGIATTTVPAVEGAAVTSLSGRVFHIGAQPAQTFVNPITQAATEETVGNIVQEAISNMATMATKKEE